jgi:DNA polymerase III epsilon subunit-like protein
VPRWTEEGTQIEWGPYIDTLRLARQRYPAPHKLESLVRLCGLQEAVDAAAEAHLSARRHYHSAGYDSIATALLWQRIHRDHLTGFDLAGILALQAL